MIFDDKDESDLRRQIKQQEKSFKRRQKEIALIEKAQAAEAEKAVNVVTEQSDAQINEEDVVEEVGTDAEK